MEWRTQLAFQPLGPNEPSYLSARTGNYLTRRRPSAEHVIRPRNNNAQHEGRGDAMLCADGPVRSLVELSLVGEHRRGRDGFYGALSAGRVDVARLRRALAAVPLPRAGGRPARPCRRPHLLAAAQCPHLTAADSVPHLRARQGPAHSRSRPALLCDLRTGGGPQFTRALSAPAWLRTRRAGRPGTEPHDGVDWPVGGPLLLAGVRPLQEELPQPSSGVARMLEADLSLLSGLLDVLGLDQAAEALMSDL
jgi:hypothetical protein